MHDFLVHKMICFKMFKTCCNVYMEIKLKIDACICILSGTSLTITLFLKQRKKCVLDYLCTSHGDQFFFPFEIIINALGSSFRLV